MLTNLTPEEDQIFRSAPLYLIFNRTPAVYLGEGLLLAGVNADNALSPFIKTNSPFADIRRIRYNEMDKYEWGSPEAAAFRAERDAAEENLPEEYGVCDYPYQIIDTWPTLVSDPDHRYIVTLDEIRKDEQPSDGGWRWHKWGTYIGDREPLCEYLYDEPEIDNVYVFHIHELNFSE